MSTVFVPSSASPGVFDVHEIRADFPILHTTAHGKPLVYLDNGATTQKPHAVIDRLSRYYEAGNANIHRGVYELSQKATAAYEEARHRTARFINAAEDAEIIFTRGTTEAINLVAATFGRAFLKAGDEIILSALEHHSNIVPWQIAAELAGATIRVIPMNDRGELLLEEYAKLLSGRTKMVAVNHVSNALGTINDVERIARLAHEVGAQVLIDGAQWVAHQRTDVQAIGCDFYCFSGHKLYGPTGIGVLWGRRELLDKLPPYQGGGDMIESVTFAKTTYAPLPNKFEAGTPDIAGAIGLAAAIDYVQSIGFEDLTRHEDGLLAHATKKLAAVPGLRIVGTAAHKAGVISFVVESPAMSPLDVGMRLDRLGIAVRTGHHCCQPIMDRLGISATTRASFAMYNTIEEIDVMTAALQQIIADEAAKRAKTNGSATAPSSSGAAEVEFPEPAASSPQAAAEELIETFDFLGEWSERYQEIISMGEHLLPLPIAFKTEATRVKGCQSTVHLITRQRPGSADAVDILADSDADIVRGLIAVLQKVFSGQSARQIMAFDVEGFLRRMGLDEHLSMGRRNGLAGMIQRIRTSAAAIAGPENRPAP